MRPLNPFLRAFFASRLPSQCSPTSQYIVLIPTTEFLLTHQDKDTQASYHELATSEELIACHVIRAAGGTGGEFRPTGSAKETGMREARSKARQYTTLNGRTVVLKDAHVFTNKGFKSHVQAQLLQDALFFNDVPDAPQWLIYFISRPLVGTPEPIPSLANPSLSPAGQAARSAPELSSDKVNADASQKPGSGHASNVAEKKQEMISSFEHLLSRFPAIGRHMQSGLDNLFRQFRTEMEDISLNAAIESSKAQDSPEPDASFSDAPTLHRRDSSASSASSISSARSGISKANTLSRYVSRELALEEQNIRKSLESLVYSAIDVFQGVDKQQLSLVGASTDLSGPAVERLIETYVAETFHDSILFPRVRGLMSDEDDTLEKNIRQMVDVDISQVGLSVEGEEQRKDLSTRVRRAVDAFKKMNGATSPHSMIDVLLETQKCLTISPSLSSDEEHHATTAEKGPKQLIVSADMLVSLLLVVVIRSPVRHLQARLAYMRDFVFVIDVDLGEIGYALSTYEAVIGYLTHQSNPLKAASRANRALWGAARRGDVAMLSSILSGDPGAAIEDEAMLPDEDVSKKKRSAIDGEGLQANDDMHEETTAEVSKSNGLSHVFPFRSQHQDEDRPILVKPKLKKRVSLEARSMSSSSMRSHLSGSSTLQSMGSLAGEIAPNNLIQTQDVKGATALLLAVENCRAPAVDLLLGLNDLYTPEQMLREGNQEGASILAIAMELGDKATILAILGFLLRSREDVKAKVGQYLRRQDAQGRCAAHYIFNCWWLILWLDVRGFSLPWKLKDRNGQTPLFAICRSYDQDDYLEMVQTAIRAATLAEGADEILHLDDHVDNKNNTLLHIMKDSQVTRKLLQYCDSDPNVTNDKKFTPLMMASKYARLDQVRTLFSDPRTDLQARDHRGLTAVELAKDDEVRNRIDDMVLLSTQSPKSDGRVTTGIVRSFFVDDGTVRFILKSAAPNSKGTITITTSRRSASEFENLSRLLLVENPASWMPSVVGFRSPFQIPSRPSRAVLRELQLRLDGFLRSLITHPTFSTHEMLWEFFLVPDIDPRMLAERAEMKAAARIEKLHEDYAPNPSISEAQSFAMHAREQVNGVHRALKHVIRRVNASRQILNDLVAASRVAETHFAHALPFLPPGARKAFSRYVATLHQAEQSPLSSLYYTLLASYSTTSAIQSALSRPASLINQMRGLEDQLSRHEQSAMRSARWTTPLGLLEDVRARSEKDSLLRADEVRQDMDTLGRELHYTQTTVASELAGWQGEGHARRIKDGLRDFARKSVVAERARLEGLRRCLRSVRMGTGGAAGQSA